jgi:cobalt/nickel transport system permease protein
MHISEGILSPPLLLVGGALSAGGLTIGLRKIKDEDLPKVAVLSSSFFVASLIHVPIGPSSAHLVLNGLLGILLGWAAFPSIFIALVLQALLFQFGGFTTLGVNTFAMATPGVISHYLFRGMLRKGERCQFIGGFAGGAIGVILGAIIMSLALIETERSFFSVAGTLLLLHFPISIIEGLITAFVVIYLKKVKPEAIP